MPWRSYNAQPVKYGNLFKVNLNPEDCPWDILCAIRVRSCRPAACASDRSQGTTIKWRAVLYMNTGPLAETTVVSHSEWTNMQLFENAHPLYLPLFKLRQCPVFLTLSVLESSSLPPSPDAPEVEILTLTLNPLKKSLLSRAPLSILYQPRHAIGICSMNFEN
jgi:hypothetical protein